ncbi:ArsR/SmtB family transcription factor [Pyxidicoccus xibeiensis]|uniref:ArsR/SmtB family transcription factor n=1 Tax=Pyxidicoccus xibeiensis TaxID=2906759 RepID=UPI0020A7B843|nr:metalloregulator ArsR/SmtB family transcription factor [Pyxidicoccus xibeiensis]MCP3143510.1 metalloregulator ArsR/SmtB family transcription factor [Pyxidicoccus xibeiensis]
MAAPAPQPSAPLTAEHRAKVFKALADPCRVRIVEMLAHQGDLCGNQLAEAMGVSAALLSHHGKVLEGAGLISKRKDGPHAYCVLNRELLAEAIRGLVD